MPNWISSIRLPRLAKRTASQPAALNELRQHFDNIAAGFGPTPTDIAVEPANLGQIKGEWVRVAGSDPGRVILYLHGGDSSPVRRKRTGPWLPSYAGPPMPWHFPSIIDSRRSFRFPPVCAMRWIATGR